MGLKTGKTIGELHMTDTILDMLQKRISIIGHPDGDGLSDGADLVNNDTMISLPNIDSEYPGANEPILIPVANIATGILSGHSVFVKDDRGEETQISFKPDTTVDLEKLSNELMDSPIGVEEALDEFESGDLELWICEVGLYDPASDPRTPFETVTVAVAEDTEFEARDKAAEVAKELMLVSGDVLFEATGNAEKTTREDLL